MKNIYLVEGSPVDYEELVVYIVVDKKYVALVQKDEGKDKMIVEFLEDSMKPKIYLDDFIEAVQQAKELLLK